MGAADEVFVTPVKYPGMQRLPVLLTERPRVLLRVEAGSTVRYKPRDMPRVRVYFAYVKPTDTKSLL